MLYQLDARYGLDTSQDEGIIYIHINAAFDGSNETLAWEWHGRSINTGDLFQWRYGHGAYGIRLLYAGNFFASLVCAGWRVPSNSNNEPQRPWFRWNTLNLREGQGERLPTVGAPQDSFSTFIKWSLL